MRNNNSFNEVVSFEVIQLLDKTIEEEKYSNLIKSEGYAKISNS